MSARSASHAAPEPARDPVAADLERVLSSYDTCYVWRYGSPTSSLRELYAKPKRDQWDGASDLDGSIIVASQLVSAVPMMDAKLYAAT